MRSAYGQQTAWTVTVLERVSDKSIERFNSPLDLYVADQFLLSRVAAPGIFEPVETIAFGSSRAARR
jgi:hypothetical protein